MAESRNSDGVSLILLERKRQLEELGWTTDHDRQHQSGELVDAAVVYATYSDTLPPAQSRWLERLWPWEPEQLPKIAAKRYTKNGRMRNLVKAGALLAAEIDRLQAEIADEEEVRTSAYRH